MKIQPVQGEFLSNLFLAGEKDRENRPVIALKIFNDFIPFTIRHRGSFSIKALNTGRSSDM